MTREAMKLALEVLEYIEFTDNDRNFLHTHERFMLDKAIDAIKEALAQPEQNGQCKRKERLIRIMGTFDLATGHADTFDELLDSLESELRDVLGHYREALAQTQEPQIAFNSKVIGYAAPQRTWIGLTDDEATQLWESTDDRDSWELLKRVEAKLKERNT